MAESEDVRADDPSHATIGARRGNAGQERCEPLKRANLLRWHGLAVWLDDEQILPGDNFVRALGTVIDRVPCCSPEPQKTPILLAERLHPFLRSTHRADFRYTRRDDAQVLRKNAEARTGS
jgi:hypothetical protein